MTYPSRVGAFSVAGGPAVCRPLERLYTHYFTASSPIRGHGSTFSQPDHMDRRSGGVLVAARVVSASSAHAAVTDLDLSGPLRDRVVQAPTLSSHRSVREAQH